MAGLTKTYSGDLTEFIAGKIWNVIKEIDEEKKIEESEASKEVKDAAKKLLKDDKVVNVYDPLCLKEVKEKFGDKLNYFDSVEDCFKSGELVVVALQYDEFKSINDDWKSFDNQIVLDCWRFLDENKFKKIDYKCLGKRKK